MFLNKLLQVDALVELIRLRAGITDVAFGIKELGNLDLELARQQPILERTKEVTPS